MDEDLHHDDYSVCNDISFNIDCLIELAGCLEQNLMCVSRAHNDPYAHPIRTGEASSSFDSKTIQTNSIDSALKGQASNTRAEEAVESDENRSSQQGSSNTLQCTEKNPYGVHTIKNPDNKLSWHCAFCRSGPNWYCFQTARGLKFCRGCCQRAFGGRYCRNYLS